MDRVILGNTGLSISRVGFGGIPIQRITQEEVCQLMKRVADAGINFIDTAKGYTVSEKYLGCALGGCEISSFWRQRACLAQKRRWQQILLPVWKH